MCAGFAVGSQPLTKSQLQITPAIVLAVHGHDTEEASSNVLGPSDNGRHGHVGKQLVRNESSGGGAAGAPVAGRARVAVAEPSAATFPRGERVALVWFVGRLT